MMTKISYSGYRFPPEIIQHAIWLYLGFTLSFRDVEDLLAERGILVSYESVRRHVNHFGPKIAADLRKRRSKRLDANSERYEVESGRRDGAKTSALVFSQPRDGSDHRCSNTKPGAQCLSRLEEGCAASTLGAAFSASPL